MRTILFASLFALAFSSDIIKEHILNGLDKNVSPCDDFYAHVCPIQMTTEQTVPSMIYTQNQKTMSQIDVSSLFVRKTRLNVSDHPVLELYQTCVGSEEGRQLWGDIASLLITQDPKNYTCDHIVPIFAIPTLFKWIELVQKGQIAQKAVGFKILLNTVGSLNPYDNLTASLFEELKSTARENIKETPWIKTYNVLDKYLNFTNNDMPYIQFALQDAITYQEIVHHQLEVSEQCAAKLNKTEIGFACLLYGIIASVNQQYLQSFVIVTELAVADLQFQAVNMANRIFVSRPAQLLGYDLRGPEATARKFGTLGFSLGHEIMHSLFHSGENDPPELKNYWTNSSACVTRQYNATCKAFLQAYCVSGTANTFEEDGADVAGMRLAYATFKKAINIINTDIRGITQDQMFFYAFAAAWCEEKNTRFAMTDNIHSQSYVRVNSLVSQMDEWKTAFKCRDDSRMVRTKTEHCSIYGFDAPITRKGFP